MALTRTVTLRLTLSDAQRAVLGSPDVYVVCMVDDGDPPGVDFEKAAYEVSEGAGQVTITAALSAPSGWAVTVDWATSDGTAQAPQDYAGGSGALTFPPGKVRASFAVAIVDDDEVELGETARLFLSNVQRAILGVENNPALLTILDDDGPGGSRVFLPSISCARLHGAGR